MPSLRSTPIAGRVDLDVSDAIYRLAAEQRGPCRASWASCSPGPCARLASPPLPDEREARSEGRAFSCAVG
jgi:hypothetical protein